MQRAKCETYYDDMRFFLVISREVIKAAISELYYQNFCNRFLDRH